MDGGNFDKAVVDEAPWSARTKAGVWALGAGAFALVGAEFLPMGLLTPIAHGLRVSEGLAGQTVTATAVTGAVAAIGAALVVGKADRKYVLFAFAALAVVSNILAALAPSIGWLLVARLFLGAAIGGFWSMAAAIAQRVATPATVGRAMSIVFAGVSLATICAPPVGAMVAASLTWRAAFVAAAVVAVAVVLLQAVVLPALAPAGATRLGTVLGLLRQKGVRRGLVIVLLLAGGHFAAFTFIRAGLEAAKPSAAVLSGELLLFGAANFVGNLVFGRFVDRHVRGVVAVAGLMLGSAVGLSWLGGASVWTEALAVAAWGFAFGGVPIGVQMWMAKAAPDRLEAVGGLMVAMFQVAIATGAAVGGAVFDRWGVAGPFGLAATAAVLAAVLAVVSGPEG